MLAVMREIWRVVCVVGTDLGGGQLIIPPSAQPARPKQAQLWRARPRLYPCARGGSPVCVNVAALPALMCLGHGTGQAAAARTRKPRILVSRGRPPLDEFVLTVCITF